MLERIIGKTKHLAKVCLIYLRTYHQISGISFGMLPLHRRGRGYDEKTLEEKEELQNCNPSLPTLGEKNQEEKVGGN